MPQIFHRSFNVISRVSIFGAVFFLAALGWIGAKTVRAPSSTGAFNAIEQPVPFSHRHHVGGLKIDCRYCHTSVEESAFAGMPTSKTCMNCHSQIWVGSPMLAPVRDSYRPNGPPLEWNRRRNGTFDITRTLPNGIKFGAKVIPKPATSRQITSSL